MMDATKYSVGYYPPPVEPGHVYEWPQKDHIEQAPAWCSVDLRDGNQSLIVPMSLEEKLEFYDMLVKIGFKEIEVGFPAASETEYEFLRTLIDGNRIPQDVTVQVLTQCRDHIIRKTFEASKHLKYRDSVILSTHPHNDRGCGVADAELAVLAGAQRIECCLFGNGERTGNVDAITLAMNMYSHGVDPHLDFSNMPAICEVYERVTRMHVYERTPYAGALVFAAFSGSHQDAIAKGMTWRREKQLHQWTCPYIPIDPHDIGRTYDADVIRINSQSGKGGIGFLLQQNYGYNPPPKMREDLGYRVKDVSDHEHRELSVKEVLGVFENSYLNHTQPLNVPDAHFIQNSDGSITANVVVTGGGSTVKCTATGNGRLDAVATAIEQQTGMHFTLVHYSEHALDSDTNSRACSYVGLKWASGEETWGCGTHTDIIVAGIKALVSAINNK